VVDRMAKKVIPSERSQAKIADAPLADKAAAADSTIAKIGDSISNIGAATHSTARTTFEQVVAATAVADRLTVATSVAILMARPEIKSVSDLAGKSVAIDSGQSGSSDTIRIAIVKAGAADVHLAENQTKALERVLGGEAAAAVLTLASPEAAENFPEISGFRIFRIPVMPGSSQAKVTDLQPATDANIASSNTGREKSANLPSTSAVAVHSPTRTTRQLVAAATAVAEQITSAIEEARESEQKSTALPPSNSTNPRIAILIARPELKSVSDLAGKEIAIDDNQSASGSNVLTAIAAAGAAEVRLNESQTKGIDRVISGEVPAAVLTLAAPEAAEAFPEVKGFKIFRIPLSARSN
jgi:TRAP-type uncharacterized transport system substrate-binding protein